MTGKCGFIALAGRPNAGKSTFINHVLGEKVSIVSDKPQTTRNRILGIYHGENLQVGFLDLPGIHKPKYKMNRVMMRSVSQGLEDADLVYHFVDISVPVGSGDRFVRDFLAKRELPVILVLNKMDLVNKNKVIAVLDQVYKEFQPSDMVPISALEGTNIKRLLEVTAGYLPEGEKLFRDDELTDQPLRFMAAELIREKILHFTREEIPHACAVSMTEFTLDEDEDRYYLAATIWAERAAHRRILLGAGGSMISKIRTGARRSLKDLLQKPVDLELFVKVAEKWRDREDMMDVIDFRDLTGN
ncbi:MAG: GTPase Era [Acidobacteriota bacterium]|nr:GTPase Era [Acidobacteriota bacterium]